MQSNLPPDSLWQFNPAAAVLSYRIRSNAGTHLHSPRLDAWLVAELHQGHQHGEPQPANQDVEHPRHIAQTERACLVLSAQTDGWKRGVMTSSLMLDMDLKASFNKPVKGCERQVHQ